MVQRQTKINLKSSWDNIPAKRVNVPQATHSKSIWMLNVAAETKSWNGAKVDQASLKSDSTITMNHERSSFNDLKPLYIH